MHGLIFDLLLISLNIRLQGQTGLQELLVLIISLNLDCVIMFELTGQHSLQCLREFSKGMVGDFYPNCLDLALVSFERLVHDPVAWLLIALKEILTFQ